MPITFSSSGIPKRVELSHLESTVLTGSAIAIVVDTAQIDNGYFMQSPSAQNDEFSLSIWLRAGTYTFTTLGIVGPTHAIVTWTLDGTLIQTVDWYNASTTRNIASAITNVSVSTDGYH